MKPLPCGSGYNGDRIREKVEEKVDAADAAEIVREKLKGYDVRSLLKYQS